MCGCTDENLITADAADKLITAHDGDVALLYLHIRRSGSRDAESAARTLCRTMGEINAALEKLERMGLITPEKAPGEKPADKVQTVILPPPDELPEYRTDDIVKRGDPVFSDILSEAQKTLGHALSTPDIRKLFGIYDYLRLPPEVIMMLLNHCVAITRGRDGMGRLPSMRFIEKEAYAWANNEVLTIEQADEYIRRSRLRRDDIRSVCAVIGIRGRAPTPTETKYINSWLDMGFSTEAIALAYDRTVANTGALKWSYMNKILSNWKEKGLYTASEIEEKDSRRRPVTATPAEKSIDMNELEKMLKEL